MKTLSVLFLTIVSVSAFSQSNVTPRSEKTITAIPIKKTTYVKELETNQVKPEKTATVQKATVQTQPVEKRRARKIKTVGTPSF